MQEQKTTYGLVGYPVRHSLSPRMHNTAFQALGVEATYELFPLKEDELAGFFQDLRADDSPIFGLNVTVPYKEKAVAFMDSLSPYAQKVGAVNTVVISPDRKLTGHNTDGPGFLTHLTELGFDPTDKEIAVLGAGGAARAIISVLGLIPERPRALRIYDMDQDKAQSLLADLGDRFDLAFARTVNSIDDLVPADLLINATPVGMHAGDACLVDAGMLRPGMLVYDLIYNPAETPLLRLAKEQGARTANGLGMLFYQGVLAFQHWAGMPLTQEIKDQMWTSLNEGLAQ